MSNMKKKGFLTTVIMAGAAALAGAAAYKINKDQKLFSKEKWDQDVSKRYRMADNLVRSEQLIGMEKDKVIELLGVNGLRSNTNEAIEYYLGVEEEEPKLLILDFDEENKVCKCTACI